MTYNARVAVMHQITKIIDFGKGVEFSDLNDTTTIGEVADRIIAMVERGFEESEHDEGDELVEPYSSEDVRVTAGMHEAIEEPTNFRGELQSLINRHSVENHSNTPDFILASFLEEILINWNIAIKSRDAWYGFEPFKESR